MTRDCHEIYRAAIQAVDPVFAVKKHVRPIPYDPDAIKKPIQLVIGGEEETSQQRVYNLSDYDNVVIVAFGKASSAMATAVLEQLLECVSLCHEDDAAAAADENHNKIIDISGLVIVKDGHATPEQVQRLNQHNITVREASHPVPDQRSVDASNELLQLVRERCSSSKHSSERNALVLACISGGGSALFCAPHPSLTLNDLQATNTALLQSGLTIQEMNVIRKRLELGKGGRLAAAAYPRGHVVSLILSDVLGDPLDLIASGPTVPDTSTWKDAWGLIQSMKKQQKQQHRPFSLPSPVMRLLEQGEAGQLEDSPSRDHPVFANAFHCLVGNNALAVTAAAQMARSLQYHPIILGTHIEGESKDVAKVLVGMAQYLGRTNSAVTNNNFAMAQLPAALLMGGETTVSLPPDPHGQGGRNQEFALAAANALRTANLRQIVVASIGTDGSDGPTDAAGAIVDGATIDRLPDGNSQDALQQHNAYPYLAQTDRDGISPLVKVRSQ